MLAVALHNSVYLWDATQGDIILLMKLEREEDYICSLSWTKEGRYLAIGTSDCNVQVRVPVKASSKGPVRVARRLPALSPTVRVVS